MSSQWGGLERGRNSDSGAELAGFLLVQSGGNGEGTATLSWLFCPVLPLVLNYQSDRITQAVNLSTG